MVVLTILSLAGVTATQAATYNGDLLVGFTIQSGKDLVYDLGSKSSITNGQVWHLNTALTAANLQSSLATVQWGVIGDANPGVRTCWITVDNGSANPVANRNAFNNIDLATSALVANNFGAVGIGNYATPTVDLSYCWYQVTALGSGTFSGFSQYPCRTGLGAMAFWEQIANGSAPTQLGTFTLSAGGDLTYAVGSAPSNSTNAYLTSLVLNPAGLTSTFVSNTFSYLATNAYGNSPTVTVINADTTATNRLIYNNSTNLLASGAASAGLSLTLGVTNVAQVQVTAQDGVTVYNYQVNIVEQPSLTRPLLTNSVSGGTNLVLAWPADHLGYRLLMQTNNLSKGVSANSNDWGTVVGSAAVTATNLPITKTNLNNYYRLVYP